MMVATPNTGSRPARGWAYHARPGGRRSHASLMRCRVIVGRDPVRYATCTVFFPRSSRRSPVVRLGVKSPYDCFQYRKNKIHKDLSDEIAHKKFPFVQAAVSPKWCRAIHNILVYSELRSIIDVFKLQVRHSKPRPWKIEKLAS